MSLKGYTANFQFGLIDYTSRPWHDDEYANWNLLDGILANIGNDVPFTVDTGPANSIVLAYGISEGPPVTPFTAYYAGMRISFKNGHDQVGHTTVNVDGLGPQTILLNGADPVVGDLVVNAYVEAVYDGTEFICVVPNRHLDARHIILGTSGATALSPGADGLTLESNTDTGFTILGPATAIQRICYADPSFPEAGELRYDHNTDIFYVRVNNVDQLSIDKTGAVVAPSFHGTFFGTLTGNVVGTLTGNVLGNVTGNVTGTVGSANKLTTARTITLAGDVSGAHSFDGTADITINTVIAAKPRTLNSGPFYVDGLGGDDITGDGLSATTQWKTISHALAMILQKYDLNGVVATVQCTDAPYTTPIDIQTRFTGGQIILRGNETTPANCTLTVGGSSSCVTMSNDATIHVRGFKVSAPGGVGFYAQQNGGVHFQNCDFGACLKHVQAQDNGFIHLTSPAYTISAGAQYHAYGLGGNVNLQASGAGSTITLLGAPVFTSAFIAAEAPCTLSAKFNAFVGTMTGSGWSAKNNGLVATSATTAAITTAGCTAGTTGTGGQVN